MGYGRTIPAHICAPWLIRSRTWARLATAARNLQAAPQAVSMASPDERSVSFQARKEAMVADARR